MLVLTNRTTKRLEGYARARGLDVDVIKSPGNACGVFFVSGRDGVLLSRWVSLGWTESDAREIIEEWARQGEGE